MDRVIAIDFDGTLCESRYPDIGPPKTAVIDRAKQEKAKGSKLILYTCREGQLLENAVEWCRVQGLEFDAINDNLPGFALAFGYTPRKVSATEYWDDRAVPVDEKSCETCTAYKHTSSNKHHPVAWCANTCKNYRQRETDA